jgi:type VI secretion system protein ImpF
MARRDATGPVTLSVLDRLIDRDPKTRSEIPFTRAQSLRELKLALKRDLEWLLNTRKTIDPSPDSARETVLLRLPLRIYRHLFQIGFVQPRP